MQVLISATDVEHDQRIAVDHVHASAECAVPSQRRFVH